MKNRKYFFIFVLFTLLIIGCKKNNSDSAVDLSSKIIGTYYGTFKFGDSIENGTVALLKQSTTLVILNETRPNDNLFGYSSIKIKEGDSAKMYLTLNTELVNMNGIVKGNSLDYSLNGHHFSGTKP